MIEWIISSSVLILTVSALRLALRGRISQRIQYALWALVLLRLLLPVSLGGTYLSVMNAAPEAERGFESLSLDVTPRYSAQEGGAEIYSGYGAPPEGGEDRAGASGEGAGAADSARELKLAPLMRGLWLAGAAVTALSVLVSNLLFGARLRKTRRAYEGDSRAPVRVYISPAVETPCLFGVAAPAIYLTPEAAGNAAMLRHALEHETTHFRHGDHLWSLLRCLALALHWYNPLVWLAAGLSRRDAELACDEGTIERIGEGERGEYGRTLICLSCKKRAAPALFLTATTMTGGKGALKERVTRIARKPKMTALTLSAALLIAALAAGCTFTGAKGGGADGPPVFTRLDQVFSIVIYEGPVVSISEGTVDPLAADEEHFGELLEWVSAFTLGDRQEEGRAPEPEAGGYTIILCYADGSAESGGVDLAVRDGAAYHIVRPDFPEAWYAVLDMAGADDIESLIIDALNSDGAYAEAVCFALANSLIENPAATLEAIGARQEAVAAWLCWSLAYGLRDAALDPKDALSAGGLSENGEYARGLLRKYLSEDAPAPIGWRQAYLGFWDSEAPMLQESAEIIALGLFDTQSDGVPEFALWYESSTDGVLYHTDGASVYHNVGAIYEGLPPEGEGSLLRAQNGEGLDHASVNAFLNSWRP